MQSQLYHVLLYIRVIRCSMQQLPTKYRGGREEIILRLFNPSVNRQSLTELCCRDHWDETPIAWRAFGSFPPTLTFFCLSALCIMHYILETLPNLDYRGGKVSFPVNQGSCVIPFSPGELPEKRKEEREGGKKRGVFYKASILRGNKLWIKSD